MFNGVQNVSITQQVTAAPTYLIVWTFGTIDAQASLTCLKQVCCGFNNHYCKSIFAYAT